MKRIRFSLRFMLVVVALMALPATWAHYRMELRRLETERIRKQLQARLGEQELVRRQLMKERDVILREMPPSRRFLKPQIEAEARHLLGTIDSEIAGIKKRIQDLDH